MYRNAILIFFFNNLRWYRIGIGRYSEFSESDLKKLYRCIPSTIHQLSADVFSFYLIISIVYLLIKISFAVKINL